MTLLGQPAAGPADRIGIVASKRLGNAVVRNRAKRRLREVFRRQDTGAAGTDETKALDLVVIPRRELVAAPFSTIQADFQAALRRLRTRT